MVRCDSGRDGSACPLRMEGVDHGREDGVVSFEEISLEVAPVPVDGSVSNWGITGRAIDDVNHVKVRY